MGIVLWDWSPFGLESWGGARYRSTKPEPELLHMGRWLVEYQGSDNKPKTTTIELGDKYKTAAEVQSALAAGQIDDLYIGGDIVRVQKLER